MGGDPYAVILFNRTEPAAEITVTWASLELPATSVLVRDLWLRQDLDLVDEQFTATVSSHGVVTATVTGQ